MFFGKTLHTIRRMAHSGGPPPGWYPDPAGGGGLRWWDGARWTEHTAAPQPGYGGVDPERALHDERGMARWARWAIIGYAVAILAGGYVAQQMFANLDRLMADAMAQAEAGRQRSPVAYDSFYGEMAGPAPAAYQLLNLVQLGAFILLLVWIYRAATTARALGIPGRYSPGWAVGGWFIPIANLFIPVQCLRDLLPPGHTTRRTILTLWLVAIAGYLVGFAGLFATAFGSGSGVVAIVGFLIVAAMVVLGRSVIDEILESHERIAAERRAGTSGAQVRW